MKVYIAGPLTSSGIVEENIVSAITAADILCDLGFTPFIPHLNMQWHNLYPHDDSFWLKWDFQWIDSCDALFVLPGYSEGTLKEIEYANLTNKPVFYCYYDIIRWAK